MPQFRVVGTGLLINPGTGLVIAHHADDFTRPSQFDALSDWVLTREVTSRKFLVHNDHLVTAVVRLLKETALDQRQTESGEIVGTRAF